jgi:hypothetical protein
MKLVKNQGNEEGRRFWDTVERCAEHVRTLSDWQRDCPVVAMINRVAERQRSSLEKGTGN